LIELGLCAMWSAALLQRKYEVRLMHICHRSMCGLVIAYPAEQRHVRQIMCKQRCAWAFGVSMA
jgi:hypothetical protein